MDEAGDIELADAGQDAGVVHDGGTDGGPPTDSGEPDSGSPSTDAGFEDLDGGQWWTNIVPACASPTALAPEILYAESADAGALLADAGVPMVLWQRRDTCSGTGALLVGDDQQSAADTVLTRLYADGEDGGSIESIASVFHVARAQDLYTRRAQGLSHVAQSSGAPIECESFAADGSLFESSEFLACDDSTGRCFVTAVEASPLEQPSPSPWPAAGVIGIDGATIAYRALIDADGPADYFLMDRGQILTERSGRVVSHDVSSGDILWTLGGEQLRADAQPGRSVKLGGSSVDQPLVRAYANGTTRVYTVDECGTPTFAFEYVGGSQPNAGTIETPVPLLGSWVFIAPASGDAARRLVVHDGLSVAFQEFDCRHFVTTGMDRVACMFDRVGGAEGREIVIREFGLGGQGLVERVVSTSGTLDRNSFIAAEGGVVIVTATIQLGESLIRRIYFVSLSTDAPTESFDLTVPDVRYEYDTTAPLLNEDGVLFVSMWGQITAIQTRLPGLAPSPYPRGPSLGGNQNRGACEVAEATP